MAKKPDRRSVEEIEFVIHYLDRFDYWTKISDIKNHDDDAKKYAATGHNKRSGSGGGGVGTVRVDVEVATANCSAFIHLDVYKERSRGKQSMVIWFSLCSYSLHFCLVLLFSSSTPR